MLKTTLFLLVAIGSDVFAQKAPAPGELAASVAAGDMSMIDELLYRGADPNQPDLAGCTPLGYAVESGSYPLVHRILVAGADPNGAEADGRTPLMTVIRHSRADLMVKLLSEGADPNRMGLVPYGKGFRSASPLSVAVNRGEREMALRLVAAGADPTRTRLAGDDKPDPLRLPEIDIPLDHRMWTDLGSLRDSANSPDWNAGDSSDAWLLHRSARDNAWMTARAALDNGMFVDSADERLVTPLMTASWAGENAMVSLFLQRGADPTLRDESGRNSLCYAAAGGHIDILRLILAADLAPEAYDSVSDDLSSSPLYYALAASRPEALSLLLEAGFSTTGTDEEDISLLMMAAWTGDFSSLSRLLSLSDAGARDEAGRTALEWAAAAFDRDRRIGREVENRERGGIHYPSLRLLAGRQRNPEVYATQPTTDMNPIVISAWSPGKNPSGAEEWRRQRPSSVPMVPGDGDLTLYRILRDEEPGTPTVKFGG